MKDILSFANTVSPLGVIALLVIVIIQLINGKGFLSKIFGIQSDKYPKFEEHLEAMRLLQEQNEVLLENHFKHEIPDMAAGMVRIEGKVDTVITIQNAQGNRITRLEALGEK